MSKLSSLFHFRNQLSRRKLCAQGMSNAISFPSFISTAGSVARQTFSTDGNRDEGLWMEKMEKYLRIPNSFLPTWSSLYQIFSRLRERNRGYGQNGVLFIKFCHRNQLSRRKLCAQGMSNAISFPSFISTAGSVARQTFSTDASGKLTSRVFAEYSVYKGKAALTAKPVLPTFSRTNSGDLKLDRQGIILLTISPAIGERKYDWEKKQYFALSPTEIGSLISLESTHSCEFFHDPSMKSSNAGKVRKSLSIRPHDGGYFFQLSVVNNILKSNDRFTIPITTAEFAVMRTAFSFALPHLMGWDQFTNQIPGTAQESSSKVVPASLDSEWNQ